MRLFEVLPTINQNERDSGFDNPLFPYLHLRHPKRGENREGLQSSVCHLIHARVTLPMCNVAMARLTTGSKLPDLMSGVRVTPT